MNWYKKLKFADNNIPLNDLENRIFSLLREVVKQSNLQHIEMRVAGGWIRDKLMGKESDDIDIALTGINGFDFARAVDSYSKVRGIKDVGDAYEISLDKTATPNEARGENELAVGGLPIFGQKIEFVELRKESYPDPNSRTPVIVPTDNVQEDAMRRDLTINALYYNIRTGKVEDYTGGLDDLKNMFLTTPDDPGKTYMEDPLRLLRAIRFYSRYPDSHLDPEIIKMLQDSGDPNSDIGRAYEQKVAPSRASAEFIKMMKGEFPERAIRLLFETGFYKRVFEMPENWNPIEMDQKNKYHRLTLLDHTMGVVQNINSIAVEHGLDEDERTMLLLSALFHDFGKMNPSIQTEHPKQPGIMRYLGHEDSSSEFTDQVMKRMSFPESLRKSVTSIVGGHMAPGQFEGLEGRKAYGKYGKFLRNYGDLSKYILLLRQADRMSKGEQSEEELEQIRQQQAAMHGSIDDYQQLSQQKYERPSIRGDELIAMLPEVNPQLGDTLQRMGFKYFITNRFTDGQPMHWIKYVTEQLLRQQQNNPEMNEVDARGFVLGIMKQIFSDMIKQIPPDVQSFWKQIFKLAEVRGEFWLQESGGALYADGDTGDYNHEGYVIEYVRNQMMEGDEDWEEWKDRTAKEKFAEKMDEAGGIPEQQHSLQIQFDDNPEEFLFEELREKGISDEDYSIAEGFGDAREYAMKKWGWKRVEGNNIETWTLTPEDLQIISSGLWDAYDEEAETSTFNIYVYGTKKSYNNIPLDIIDKGKVHDIIGFDSMTSGY